MSEAIAPNARLFLETLDRVQTRIAEARMQSSREWDALRDRLPLLDKDARDILEHDSECRAEFGMSYVCGGGQVDDVGAAFAQFGQEDRLRLLVAEADRTLRERFDLHVSERDLDMALLPLGVPLSDPDDIPF